MTHSLDPTTISWRSRRNRLEGNLAGALLASPAALVAAVVLTLLLLAALLAPIIAPQNAFSPGALNLLDGKTPPLTPSLFTGRVFLLGTDDQGRDILSAILYGARISFLVGIGAVLIAVLFGGSLGLVAGWRGGRIDTLIMRLADVQLGLPPILMALLLFGVSRAALPAAVHDRAIVWLIILAIALATWPQYARMVRGLTLVEMGKEYIEAARIMGLRAASIALRHIVPNIAAPVLVAATLGFAVAVIAEATLSFLGAGIPATQPSLGSLIRIGQEYVASGEWWMLFFPAVFLVVLSLSVNIVGDWLRETLNPRLR